MCHVVTDSAINSQVVVTRFSLPKTYMFKTEHYYKDDFDCTQFYRFHWQIKVPFKLTN